MIAWKAHAKPIYSIAFTPDSSAVVTASGNETVKLWDWANKAELRSWPGSKFWSPLAVSADGRFVARGGYGVAVWPTDAAEPALEAEGFTEAVDFSPDSSVFAAHGNSGVALRRWKVPGFKTVRGGWGGTRTESSFPTGAMRFSRDGGTLATTFGVLNEKRDRFDSVIVLRDAFSGKETARLTPAKPPPAHASELAFTPDGSHMAAIYGPVLIVWDVASGTEACRQQPSKKHFKGLSCAPDGRLLTACNDHSLQMWLHPGWQEAAAFDWKIGRLLCVAVSVDGTMAAAGSATGRVIVWDLE